MRNLFKYAQVFSLIFSLASCDPVFAATNTKVPAKDVTASGFTGNLSGKTNVQDALKAIDNYTSSIPPMASSVPTSSFSGNLGSLTANVQACLTALDQWMGGVAFSSLTYVGGQIVSSESILVNGIITASQIIGTGNGNSYFTGNVGINTTNPQVPLDVNGTVNATQMNLTGTGDTILGGKVGVNTVSPSYDLDVNGTGGFTGLVLSTNPHSGYVLTDSDGSGTAAWTALPSTSINWSSINALIPSSAMNWSDINTLAPISSGGINWSSLSSVINSAAINWSDINSLAPIQSGGINWSSLSSVINSAAINWSNINSLAPIQSGGINWSTVPSGTFSQAQTNWSSFWLNSTGGMNWAAIPGSGVGNLLEMTSTGVNWTAAPSGVNWSSISGIPGILKISSTGTPTAVALSKTFVISGPSTSMNTPVIRMPYAVTIIATHALCIGGTNVVGQVDTYDVNGGTDTAVTTDMTATAGTTVNVTGLSVSVVSGGYVGWHTTTVGGAPTRLIVTFDYTVT